MATLAEFSSTASPLPNFNSAHDLEFDSFLNLDQTAYPTSESMKSDPSLISQPSMVTPEPSLNDMGPSYNGPSHQYGDHQQQTGFPPDAVAHAMAYNDNSLGTVRAGHQGFPMADGSCMHMKREDSTVDFGTAPSRGHSEMDIEAENGNNKNFFVPLANTVRVQQFIDPNTLGGHEMSIIAHPAPQAGRVYPGMHQQQAAMARAAQQQKQQAEIIRQQQQMRQRHAEQLVRQAQQPQPPQPQPSTRPVRQTDPVVEERISRLLQQMRQSNLGQDNRLSASTSLLPQMAKQKKDEEDMDEDERLLASEEGKKLTSKERRQLRNKVSARAFRSRRKEYITQLEGEVASKTNENNELRLQNHALAEENNRLTDLTRILLSSPHFSDVLNDLTANGLPASAQPPVQVAQPQHQPMVSQAPVPTSVAGPQVNMVIVPDNHMDLYAAGWNSGIDMNYNPSVFAVLEVPEGPVDLEALSGKSSSFETPASSCESSKVEVPQLEQPPIAPPTTVSTCEPTRAIEALDETDPCFALFLDNVPAVLSGQSSILFNEVDSGKPSQYKLVVDQESEDISELSVRDFKRLCYSMDAAFERVCRVTDHLL
ncbi:bZIP transcription factor (LziP), putative [Talaromyces stipitatus ATCC 10500]|uniref:BZIP transcription factor (LziP), putative n=1 Tax=Talaromyces stipitatus (strain ATCC 10500 / CBS 375.48 / QM 6759 / NRRL 1006) TaxID=441959 RepID=B8M0P7_TALSN|nr:bZIP transcription factor (LziP), putative [Talaromyces stipitatus ATCC 10500]EED21430.1 bZIP transcription factor (LziP), putative [Talaromyces stipitatus ATCC 10500]